MGEGPPAVVTGTTARRVPGRASLQRNGQTATQEGEGRPGGSRRVDVARLSLGAAVARLAASDALERFSPLTGAAGLIIDLRSGVSAVAAAAIEVACAQMRQLPSPTIALVDREGMDQRATGPRAVAARADVLVDSEDDLAAILDTIAMAPLAAMTLVQLLRTTLDVDIHTGLINESLAYSTLQSGPELTRWLATRTSTTPAPADEDTPGVVVERSGARLDLVLDRPATHNAFSARMRDALAEALALAAADSTITEIVLRGRGPSFCSGGDLAEFGTTPDPASAHAVRSTRSVGRWLTACAPRVRAEVHGACIGAGVELAAFAHTLAAAADAFFQLPEVGMGLVPGAGGTVSLPRRIGRQRTAWLALTRARLDAPTARAWGLVDTVAPRAGGASQSRR